MSFRILDGNAQAQPQPTASFAWAQSSYSVQEDAGSVTLSVTRSESGGTGSVDYATADETAEAGVDYTATSGTVQFADGETTKTVSVPVLNDSIYRGDRYFTATLSNASGTLGSPTLATVTVQEDEQDPNAVTSEGSLTKILVSNEDTSDVQQGQVYTFGSPIEPGAVPAGWSVEVRHNGTAIAYQMDGECRHHPDGSLNFATFAVELPALAAGETTFLELVSKDAAKPTGSVDETPLTNADYNLALTVGGTEYTASLNDALTAGDYDVERDGPVAKRYRAIRPVNDGTADHSDLWARFWATVFVDGTTQVMAQLVNGHVEVANNFEYTGLALKSGGTAVRTTMPTWQASKGIWEGAYAQPTTPNGFVYEATGVSGYLSGTTGSSEPAWPTTAGNTVTDGGITWTCRAGVTIYAHSVHSVADAEALPYWSQNKPVIHHKMDRGYIAVSRAWYAYHDLPVTDYTGDLEYVPGGKAEFPYDINSGGNSAHIGFLTNWSTKALISQAPGRDKVDRINALSWLDPQQSFFEPPSNGGRHVVLVPVDFTADGMATSRASANWYANQNVSTAATPYNLLDGTHNPQTAYYQMLKTGDEWFRDICQVQINNVIGVTHSGSTQSDYYPSYVRNVGKRDGSGDYWHGIVYRAEARAFGWNLRDLECAYWITPDASPEHGYFEYLRQQNDGFMADLVDHHETTTDYGALGVAYPLGGSGVRVSMWQSSYQACGVLSMYWHGNAAGAKAYSDYHFVKNLFGQAKDGHPYWFGSYYMHYDPDGTGTAQTWAGVDRDGSGNPFLPSGEEVPYSLGVPTTDGAVEYSVTGLGAARLAQMVARDKGDETLLEYASYVATYVEQVVKYNDPVAESEFVAIPDYRTNDYTVLDFGPDLLKDTLDALADGQWSADISSNSLNDIEATYPSGYYTVEGYPGNPVSDDNQWAYSSGDLNPHTVEYGFTGGGHNNHLDSSFFLFKFKTGEWVHADDSAKYVQGVKDTTQPFQSTDDQEYYAWRSADGSFAPAATHTYGNVAYSHYLRGWYVQGAAVYRSGFGSAGGAVVADAVTGRYKEDTAFPTSAGAYVDGVDSFQWPLDEVHDTTNNVTVPAVFSSGDNQGRLVDPLEKFSHGTVVFHWDVKPASGGFGCVVPDPDNPGRKAYITYDSDTGLAIAKRINEIPVPDRGWNGISYGNTKPAEVTKSARWLYMGDHFDGSTLIIVAQPLTTTPGVALYSLDTNGWTWSGPHGFTGSLPAFDTGIDLNYWRRFIYIPGYDCFAVFYETAVYVMKRPPALK